MISVIIPTYEEERFLTGCLSALKKCRTNDYEIIIVDAGSKDKTLSIADSFGCRIVIGKKTGVGNARNAGAAAARGDIIAFLDADSVPCENWLDIVEETFRRNLQVSAIGGPTDHGSLRYRIANFQFWLNPVTKHLGFFYFSGNNSAFRKGFFSSFGGYKPILCEDVELSLRMSRCSERMLFVRAMEMRLSPRRFERQGFFRTQMRWLGSDLKIFLGIHEPGEGYGSEIKG